MLRINCNCSGVSMPSTITFIPTLWARGRTDCTSALLSGLTRSRLTKAQSIINASKESSGR